LLVDGELSAAVREEVAAGVVNVGLAPPGRKENLQWAERRLILRTKCARFTVALPDGESHTPGDCRFRKHCGAAAAEAR